jgi:hypothetical protein
MIGSELSFCARTLPGKLNTQNATKRKYMELVSPFSLLLKS